MIGAHPARVGDDPAVRVVTYNIRHGAAADARSDLRRTSAAVASMGADLVALQEVDRHVVRSCFADQAARLGECVGLVAHFAPARAMGPFGRYGNALLVRGSATRVEHVPLDSLGEQRVAIFATVRIQEHQLTAVSTHLQNRRRGRPAEAPQQLDQLLGELRTWPQPWVLMGDLNLHPDVVIPRLEAAGLRAAESGPTFPSDRPRVRIDWIAVRGLEVCAVDVPDVRASDHRPLRAELAQLGHAPPRTPHGA